MKKIFYLSILILLIAGCANNKSDIKENIKTTTKENAIKPDKYDKLDYDIFDMSRSLATKYYKYPDKRIIKLYIAPLSSNFESMPNINSYIKAELDKYFTKKNQFVITNPIEGSPDLLIQGHIDNIDKNNFILKLKGIDSKTGKTAYNKNSIYNRNDFKSEKYQNFVTSQKKNALEASSIGTTRLQVGYISSGESYKEDDKYYQYTVNNLFFSQTILFKKDTGHSGFYPGNIKITIDNVLLKKSLNNILYDDFISPGRHEIVASFSETTWDAYNQTQIRGKVISKRFFVDVKRNDFVRVDLLCVYDGTKSDIIVKANKKKEVLCGGKVAETLVPIQIFQ